MTKKTDILLFEAFAGIGSQYQALKNIANKKHWNIVNAGIVEWFLPAIIGYQCIHGYPVSIKKEDLSDDFPFSKDSKKLVSGSWKEKNKLDSESSFWLNRSSKLFNNYFDITSVKGIDLKDNIDIFTYSFPCQDISNQGKQKGFSEGSKTRSGLLWEIERVLLEKYKSKPQNVPKYLLMENVKAILNKNHRKNLDKWVLKLEKMGYESQIYTLNSADFNQCQNRTRVFIISVLREHMSKSGFIFPNFSSSIKKTALSEILEEGIPFNKKFNKISFVEKQITKNNVKKYELANYTNFHSENYIYDVNYSGPTLTATGAMSRIKLYFGKGKIREMTPRECVRYMGFSDKAYERMKKSNSITNNHIIFLCGNSINVKVLEAIFNSFKF